MNKLYFLGLPMALFLIVVTYFHGIEVGQKDLLRLERGDEVEIVQMNSTEIENNLFEGCKVTFISAAVVSSDNIVFLLLQNCSHPYFKDKQTWYEVRPRYTIRKVFND